MKSIQIHTGKGEEMVDITSQLAQAVKEGGWDDGAIFVFCPHTTCGLTINENADPDVRSDLMRFFREIAPKEHGWSHIEGNTDAHIRSSLLGASVLAPVENGQLRLGRWQAVYLYEGDGPRSRSLWLQFLAQ